MAQYKDFIPENTAFPDTRRIGIYNNNGNRIGQIPLERLTLPAIGRKLYSFGALSDVHIGDRTASTDFTKALQELSRETDFICISGDLVHTDSDSQRAEYKLLVDTYATVPVYACAGNHDANSPRIETIVSGYTGHPLYYSLTYSEDVFIFIGVNSNTNGALFTTAQLQWLYETLETNRNKRCFVFEHVRPEDGCGNALGIYTYDIWGGNDQKIFESFLRHYQNIILFHGHSHLMFDLQKYSDTANIDQIFGCWSVHIPSLAVPRSIDSIVNPEITNIYAESEGYLVDVYENGIHLRGRDFIRNAFVPIASYWLDTPIVPVAANTYTDPTGTL